MMGALMLKYKDMPHLLSLALCDSLGAYVSIVTKDTPKALDDLSERLKATDYQQHRVNFFGFKLGVEQLKQGEGQHDGREQQSSEEAPQFGCPRG